MVPEKVTSALDLLEYHVESQRMFGKTSFLICALSVIMFEVAPKMVCARPLKV